MNLSRLFSAPCRAVRALAIVTAAPFLCLPPMHAAPILTPVVRTGVQAPGENAGVTFSGFNGFEIGNGGQVVFGAQVPSGLQGIWFNDGTTTVRAAKVATQAPGMPAGVNFSSVTLNASSGPYTDDAGRVAFRATLGTGTGGVTVDNNIGIWQGTAGALAPLYRTGSAAPDTAAGTVFSDFSGPVANRSGQIAFQGFLRGGGATSTTDLGLWVNSPIAGLRLIAREGSVAVGAGGVRTYQDPGISGDVNPFSYLQVSDGGQVVFAGRLNDDTRGLWIGDTNGTSLIALGNQQAPGVPAGALFSKTTLAQGGTRSYDLSAAGNFGFAALLVAGAGGVTSANQHGLWARTAASISLIAREGSQAPGLPIGVNFSASGSNPFDGAEVNDAGDISFKAHFAGIGITAGNDSAIWTGLPGALQVVVREGDLAPGAPAGFLFGDLSTVRPILNELGQLAFVADAKNAAGTQTVSGLWLWDPSGGLMSVAMPGDVITLAPGVVRTVSSAGANVDAAFANGRALTDAGQLVFGVVFTDGSQAILKAQVPEPATAALLGCGALLALQRRRRVLKPSCPN